MGDVGQLSNRGGGTFGDRRLAADRNTQPPTIFYFRFHSADPHIPPDGGLHHRRLESTPLPGWRNSSALHPDRNQRLYSLLYRLSQRGFKQLRKQLSYPPISASFSPQGDQIALTEGIKLYLITTDSFHRQILMSENGIIKPAGGIVWSPDGQYLAVVVEKLNCKTCRSVVLVRISDASIFFLQTPNALTGDEPRWTQDGRLLINVYPSDPAQGTAYVYDLEGKGQLAAGTFALSSSHEGQKWFPWQPGRTWQAGVSERSDAYNAD
jgi:hypothetical protein